MWAEVIGVWSLLCQGSRGPAPGKLGRPYPLLPAPGPFPPAPSPVCLGLQELATIRELVPTSWPEEEPQHPSWPMVSGQPGLRDGV